MADERNINCIFLKYEYVIAFNEKWLTNARVLEIIKISFHEARHAFQRTVISNPYSVKEILNPGMLKQWKYEFENYKQTTGHIDSDCEYLEQEIEKGVFT